MTGPVLVDIPPNLSESNQTMLSLLGKTVRHCDGISRRSFLSAGVATLGGMTLADLLRAEAAAGIGSSRKSLLILHLDGGPPQMDMWDLKPDAPAAIRGQFVPVSTNVPGIELCELLPKLATISDRCVFVRSLVGSAGAHNAFQCQSGYSEKDLKSLGGWQVVG